MRKLPFDVIIGICLLIVSGILLAISPDHVWTALRTNRNLILQVIILGLAVSVVATLANHLIPTQFAQRYLTQNKLRHLFLAGVLGILTPGPVYVLYPVLYTLKKKGIHASILVSYITGQTIIGPARIPLEVGLFGPRFFSYRLALALVLSPLAGLLYSLLSIVLPDKPNTK